MRSLNMQWLGLFKKLPVGVIIADGKANKTKRKDSDINSEIRNNEKS